MLWRGVGNTGGGLSGLRMGISGRIRLVEVCRGNLNRLPTMWTSKTLSGVLIGNSASMSTGSALCKDWHSIASKRRTHACPKSHEYTVMSHPGRIVNVRHATVFAPG